MGPERGASQGSPLAPCSFNLLITPHIDQEFHHLTPPKKIRSGQWGALQDEGGGEPVREIRDGRRAPGQRHECAGTHSEGVLVLPSGEKCRHHFASPLAFCVNLFDLPLNFLNHFFRMIAGKRKSRHFHGRPRGAFLRRRHFQSPERSHADSTHHHFVSAPTFTGTGRRPIAGMLPDCNSSSVRRWRFFQRSSVQSNSQTACRYPPLPEKTV